MPARSEIDDKFKWAVSDLYSSDEAWEKDYNSILELTEAGTYYLGGDISNNYLFLL